MADSESGVRITTDTPYFARVFCDDFGENWPRYNGTALELLKHCKSLLLHLSAFRTWGSVSELLVVYSSCRYSSDRSYSLLQEHLPVYQFCMTDHIGFEQNVSHSLTSIRHEPTQKMIDDSIADLLADYSLSSVLYISDKCKYLM